MERILSCAPVWAVEYVHERDLHLARNMRVRLHGGVSLAIFVTSATAELFYMQNHALNCA